MNDPGEFRIVSEAWSSREMLTLNQAAALWAEETPPLIWIDDPEDPQYDEDSLPLTSFKRPELFKKILHDLCDAVCRYIKNTMAVEGEAKSLPPVHFLPSTVRDEYGYKTGEMDHDYPDPNLTTVSRIWLAQYALHSEQEPLFLKKEMDNLVPYLERIPETPPYLKEDHECFSRELKIAIETWIHIFNEGNYDPSKAPLKQIEYHLKRTYSPSISDNAIKRISSLINSKKAGRPRRK